MAVDGKWNITMKTPMGDREAVLTLKQDGDALSGAMSADGQDTEIKDGKVEDGRCKWDVDVTTPMPITLSFDVEITSDNNIDGNVKLGMFGSSTVNGTPA